MSSRQENMVLAAMLAVYPFITLWLTTRELLWAVVAYVVTLGVCAVIEWRT